MGGSFSNVMAWPENVLKKKFDSLKKTEAAGLLKLMCSLYYALFCPFLPNISPPGKMGMSIDVPDDHRVTNP